MTSITSIRITKVAWRRRRALLPLLCLSALIAACSATPVARNATPAAASAAAAASPLATLSPAEFWSQFAPGTQEHNLLPFDSLTDAAKSSDAVVLGSIESIQFGPTFKDNYGNQIYEATVDVAIQEVLRGEIQTRTPGHVAVWAVLGVTVGYEREAIEARFEALRSALPRGEKAILFLNNTAEWAKRIGADTAPDADPYAYQIAGQEGYIRRDATGGALYAPSSWASKSPTSFEGALEAVRGVEAP